MKKQYFKWVLPFMFALAPVAAVEAQAPSDDQSYQFNITEGQVTITQVFCAPGTCQEQQGDFVGSFTATFFDEQIKLSDIRLKSELDFNLPEEPNLDSNGTTREAKYYFDGQTLVLEGVENNSAFDGPIVEYNLTADLTGVTPIVFDQHGYYLARQDYRKCAAPMCGGIFVKHVNNNRMQCPDGKFKKECYIGTPDWSKLGFNPFSALQEPSFNGEVLLKGDVIYDVRLGIFAAESAFYGAGKKDPKGKFYGVENNGWVCITSPCFSFDQYTLNSKKPVGKISDLDLTRTGASEKEISQAYELMAEGEPVLIAGINRKVRQMAGVGIKLVASQFYLPLKSDEVAACEEGYKSDGSNCMTANGCAYPLLELAVYGGAAPPEGEEQNITYECVISCDEPAVVLSNGYCALYLP